MGLFWKNMMMVKKKVRDHTNDVGIYPSSVITAIGTEPKEYNEVVIAYWTDDRKYAHKGKTEGRCNGGYKILYDDGDRACMNTKNISSLYPISGNYQPIYHDMTHSVWTEKKEQRAK